MRKTVAPPRYTHNLVALRIYRIPYHRTTFYLEKGSAVISKRRAYKSIKTVSLPFRVFWAGTILDPPGEQPGSIPGVIRMQRQAQTVNDSTIHTGGITMNRKLFRLITLVVTVSLALAITAPALAEKPVHYEYSYELLDCDGDDIAEIWADEWGSYLARYILDDNGEPVEVFWHGTTHLHLYNFDHPDLFINGTSVVNSHSQKIDGSWYTGSEYNFHAPGYPQLNHTSGYFYWDENGNLIYEHGRFVLGLDDTALACELLTPP